MKTPAKRMLKPEPSFNLKPGHERERHSQFGCKEINFQIPVVPGRSHWDTGESWDTGVMGRHRGAGFHSASVPFTWLGGPLFRSCSHSCEMGTLPASPGGAGSLYRAAGPTRPHALSVHLPPAGLRVRKVTWIRSLEPVPSGPVNTVTSRLSVFTTGFIL